MQDDMKPKGNGAYEATTDTDGASTEPSRRALIQGFAKAAWIVPVVWTLAAHEAQAAVSSPQCSADGEICGSDSDCCSNDCQGFTCNGN